MTRRGSPNIGEVVVPQERKLFWCLARMAIAMWIGSGLRGPKLAIFLTLLDLNAVRNGPVLDSATRQ